MQRLMLVLALVPVMSLSIWAQSKTEPAKQEKKEATKAAPPKKDNNPDAAVTPKDRKEGWWQTRHNKVLESIKADAPAVMFIGDSITQGWEGEGKKEWETRFAPMKTINLGFSGDRTQHVLWRLSEGQEMAGYVPQAAMIMIGTNNSSDNSAEQISDGIEAIVKLIRRKHPRTHILLLAVFPRSEKPDHPLRTKLAAVNKTISQLDDAKWVHYLDIGEKFLEKDGTLSKEIMPDFLHLSKKGYGIWADAVEEPLKKLLKKTPIPAKTDARGFVSIFNGKNLDGWYGWDIHGKNSNPIEMSQLKPAERAKKIAGWTADAEKHWSVQDGDLVNDGAGAYLATESNYRDYELVLEYRTVEKADSGIYLKATPQVQIWDYTEKAKFNIGADKGSGGLWNNLPGAKGKDPLVLADKAFGQWNKFRILQVGERTTVWLNDKLVVDDAVMENYWDRKKRLFPEGPIVLQTHGGEIRWRNLAVRELSSGEANAWLKSKSEAGFTGIFNGKDLTGWSGATDNYEVREGAIVCKPGKGGVLHTIDEYSNFVVRLEYKLPPGGNNGLAIRYPGSGDTAYVGMCEIQVLDDTAAMYNRLDPRQYNGSAYGMTPCLRGYLRPVGEWNYEEVTVKGSTIKVVLNGTQILDTDLSQVTKYMNDSPHPGKTRTQGSFGFAGHNDPVMFRQIEIKKLD